MQYPQLALHSVALAQRTPQTAIVFESLERIDREVEELLEKADSEGTLRTYRSRLRIFTQWCSAQGLEPLPCSPQTLARYLTDRAQRGGRAGRGVKPASLGVEIAAIAWLHKQAGIAEEALPHRDPRVWKAWKAIRRSKGAPPRRVAPLVIEELLPLVHSLPDTLIGKRDKALLLLGFGGALRRSELVALEVADITFKRASMLVMVRRSKTDQFGEGKDVAILNGRHPDTCPARALRAWLEAAGITEGQLFRSVSRHGRVGRKLGAREVARIIKRRAAAIGLEAERYSGHSLRAGLATSAAKAGKTDRKIMDQGRWSGRAMVDRYVRDACIDDESNATAGLGY